MPGAVLASFALVKERCMSRGGWSLVLAALLSLACGSRTLPVADAETDALARRAIDLVKAGDVEAFRKLMQPEVRDTATQPLLDELRVRMGEDVTLKAVSYRWSAVRMFKEPGSPTQRFVAAEYQLQSSAGYSLLRFGLKGREGAMAISDFHVQSLPGDLAVLNAWSFDRPLRGYAFLALALAVAALVLYALYRCARSRVPRKKRWLLFIALGVGAVSLNWTNGALNFRVLHLHLLGASLIKQGPYGPWMVSVGFPLGALLFLVKLRRMRQQAEQEARLVAAGLAASAADAAPADGSGHSPSV
jgi:hypothetical protein